MKSKRIRSLTFVTCAALGGVACSSAAPPPGFSVSGSSVADDGGAGDDVAAPRGSVSSNGGSSNGGSSNGGSSDAGALPVQLFSGGDPDAGVCSIVAAFHAVGCGCSMAGQTEACWTGEPSLRGVGACRDGTQTCIASTGEIVKATWGPCQGEVLDCGPMAADAAPPPTTCGCIPGKVASCDEDCGAHLFCVLNATKTCLPDGNWGTCREEALGGTTLAYVSGCTNVLHACQSADAEGLWVGDCGSLFTCGKAPN